MRVLVCYLLTVHSFGLTENELTFLASHVQLSDNVWEYGSGFTTTFLATRCKRLTSVEHIPSFAAQAVLLAANNGHRNVSVLSIPPDFPYVEGTIDDGDLPTFRSYVESYPGRADVVVIDGRARVECVRWMLERAPFGPSPETRFFLHDVNREQYAPISVMLCEADRLERLSLLRMRTT